MYSRKNSITVTYSQNVIVTGGLGSLQIEQLLPLILVLRPEGREFMW